MIKICQILCFVMDNNDNNKNKTGVKLRGPKKES